MVDSDIDIFADDTFIFCIIDQFSTLLLNNDLDKITVWANQWKMSFNPDITKQAIEVIFFQKTQSIGAPATYVQQHPGKTGH